MEPRSKLIVYIHGNEQKLGPLCDNYGSTVMLCGSIFPVLSRATKIGFYVMGLDISEGYPVELCAEVWRDAVASLHIKNMVVVDQSSKLAEISQKSELGFQYLRFKVETMTGKTLSVNVGRDFNLTSLKERIRQLDGTPVHLQQLIFNGVRLEDNVILGRFNQETIYLMWNLVAQ